MQCQNSRNKFRVWINKSRQFVYSFLLHKIGAETFRSTHEKLYFIFNRKIPATLSILVNLAGCGSLQSPLLTFATLFVGHRDIFLDIGTGTNLLDDGSHPKMFQNLISIDLHQVKAPWKVSLPLLHYFLRKSATTDRQINKIKSSLVVGNYKSLWFILHPLGVWGWKKKPLAFAISMHPSKSSCNNIFQ